MEVGDRVEPAIGVGCEVRVHDHSQLELVLDYALGEGGASGEVEGARPRFEVDLYLVAPTALDLNSTAYPKERFLADLTHRLRLHTPDLKALRKVRLAGLDRYLELGLDLGAKRRWAPRAVQEVKLFANYVNLRIKRVYGADGADEVDYRRDLRKTVKLVRRYRRRYADAVRASPLAFAEDVREAVLGVEEYVTHRVEHALSQALLAGERKAAKPLRKEHDARTERSPRTGVSAGADDVELERFAHRQSLLKKFVSEVLYLRLEEVRRDRLYRNAAAACGAALAATFAEVARYRTTAAMNGSSEFGLRIAFFLGLAVLAYVFKDRLKDLSKDYFGRFFSRRLPERDSEVRLAYVDPAAAPRRLLLGRHREEVGYERTDRLAPDVDYVWSRLAAGERRAPPRDVLRYSKALAVEPGAVAALEFPDVALKDVVRFDVSEFLGHFADPLRELTIYDSEEGCVVLQAAKVYYLDLVVRLAATHGEGDERRAQVRLEAVRAVLDKRGLVRIERPIPAGRYGWTDGRPAGPAPPVGAGAAAAPAGAPA